MTFNEWLQSLGIRIREQDDGPTYYITPDGSRYTRNSPLFDEFYRMWQSSQTDADGRSIYGTAGAPDDRSTTFIGPDGRTYSRIGDPAQQGRLQPGYSSNDFIYDPTYGWGVPHDALYRETFQEKLASAMPVLSAMAMFGGPLTQSLTSGAFSNPFSWAMDAAGITNPFSGATFGDAPGIGGEIMNTSADVVGQVADDLGWAQNLTSEFGGSLATGAMEPATVLNSLVAGGVPYDVAAQVAELVQQGVPVDQALQQAGLGGMNTMQPFQGGTTPVNGVSTYAPDIGQNFWDVLKNVTGTASTVGSAVNAVDTVKDVVDGGSNVLPGWNDQTYLDDEFNFNPNDTISGGGGTDWTKLLTQFGPTVLGSLLGGVGGGGDGNTTQTTIQDVPEWLRPYYQSLLDATAHYTGQFALQTPEETAAIQGIAQRAREGSPVLDQAQNTLQATLRGDYLNSPIQDYLTTEFGNYETPDTQYLRNTAEGQYLNANPANAWLTEQMNNYVVPDTQGLRDTASGMYLSPDSNPWLQATYDRAARGVTDQYLNTTQPRTDAMFNRAGAFGPGNSAYAEIVARNNYGLGENLGNLATDIYGGNYNTERNRQFAAQGQLPQLGLAGQAARMGAASQLGQNWNAERGRMEAAGAALPQLGNQAAGIRLGAAGQYGQNYNAERARQQQGISFAPVLASSDYEDWDRLYQTGAMTRAAPMNALNWAGGILRGTPGSTTTQTQPYYSNNWAGILGGALLGSQFGKSLFGS